MNIFLQPEFWYIIGTFGFAFLVAFSSDYEEAVEAFISVCILAGVGFLFLMAISAMTSKDTLVSEKKIEKILSQYDTNKGATIHFIDPDTDSAKTMTITDAESYIKYKSGNASVYKQYYTKYTWFGFDLNSEEFKLK